jgi:DNA-binding transcriptional LysR family regulator
MRSSLQGACSGGEFAVAMGNSELTSLDLNLLRALHALLVERHVGRAARRTSTSQPAMSRALARLRRVFADELLVRVGQTMQPTPRAQQLLPALEDVLVKVRDLVAGNQFDPTSATGTVRIAALDILTYMLAPQLLQRLALEAPHIDLQIVQWSHRWREHLESGEVDLTIGQPFGGEPGIYSQLLIRNTWACVLRRGHPALAARWTKERFANLSHLLIDVTGTGGGQVDVALAKHGLRRRIALRLPYVVLSPLIVAETDLVLTTAKWLAETLAARVPLAIRPPPVRLAPVDLPMVWHERTHRDARQRWFRELLRRVASEQAGASRHAPGES